MDDAREQQLRTRFLLGTLDPAERGRMLDRLEAEPTYFEEMAAAEDDLILRYHRHQLTEDEQAAFTGTYLRSPARQARVDETLALVESAMAWKSGEGRPATSARRERPGTWFRTALDWLGSPIQIPRLAPVTVLGAAAVLAVYVASRPVEQAPAVRVVTFATALTAVGERGPSAASGMDRLRIPAGTEQLRLSFEIETPRNNEQFAADLEALEGGAVAQPSTPLIDASNSGATVTVTTAVPPDGDYVLRLRRIAGGPPVVVATHAFRVKRDEPSRQ